MPKTFGIKIAGPQGSGIQSAGESLFEALISAGYYALGYPEYNSLIKGGHSSYLITLSDTPSPINTDTIDLLVCFTKESYEVERRLASPDTHILVDQNIKTDNKTAHLHQPALIQIAKNAGNPLVFNTVALGFISVQLKLPDNLLIDQIIKGLTGKSQTLLDQNKKAYQDALLLSHKYFLGLSLPETKNKDSRLVMTGSIATGLGAISAGLNFYAGYPMTPSSALLHFLAAKQTEFSYLVKQAEDEISAINMSIGASFAGARSMTGTSGGGFALMQEGVSLAGMLETPLVIYLAMRPGPATGLPTWTSQSDLLFAINAGHGEFPKIVLAPSDPTESYLLTHKAFELSQAFHIPVIILSDKYLAENLYCQKPLPALDPVSLSINLPTGVGESFARYQYSPTGVSPRTVTGMTDGNYLANSDEHDQFGLVDESAENRQLMNQRRINKSGSILKVISLPEIKGDSQDLLISWGSTRHIVSAVALQTKSSHLHFSTVYPLPTNLATTLKKYKRIIVIENNLTHQFSRLITSETGILPTLNIGSDDGRPLNPKIIIKQIQDA